MSQSLSDLRYLFYGGGSDAEYQFLLQQQIIGRTAVDAFRQTFEGDQGIEVIGPDEDGVIVVQASNLLYERTRAVILGADHTVAQSDVTLEDVTGFLIPFVGNATYEVEGTILYDASTTADFRLGFSATVAITSFNWSTFGLTTGATNHIGSINCRNRTLADDDQSGGAGVGTIVVCRPKGTLITSSTAGSLQFRAAQGVSDATNTTVRAGSMLKLTRVV